MIFLNFMVAVLLMHSSSLGGKGKLDSSEVYPSKSDIREECALHSQALQEMHKCLKSKFKDFFLESEYSLSALILQLIIEELEGLNDLEVLKYADDLAVYRDKLISIEYDVDLPFLDSVYKDNGYFRVFVNDRSWVVDTGATFGAVDRAIDKCPSLYGSTEIIGALGNLESTGYCTFELDRFGNIPLNIASGPRVLGLAYLIPHRVVYLRPNRSSEGSLAVPFGYNGQYLVINGSLIVDESRLDNSNMCLDSGAKKSVISAAAYASMQGVNADVNVEILRYSTPFGERVNLVKKMPDVTIEIQEHFFSLKGIPAVISNNISYDCDIILGMDFIANVISLNFDEKYVFIESS